MPQQSAIYGVARVRALENGLINSDRLIRLADCADYAEAYALLTEFGYGNPNEDTLSLEEQISFELQKVYSLVRELTTDRELSDLFILKADMLNLKHLLKLKAQKISELPAMERGVFPAEQLAAMVKDNNYKDLPKQLGEELQSAAEKFTEATDPQHISVCVDSIYIRYGLSFKNDFAGAYFKALSDFYCIGTLLRLKSIGAPLSKFKELLMPEGNIPARSFIRAYELPVSQLASVILLPRVAQPDNTLGAFRKHVRGGLEEAQRTGSVYPLEKARENHLIYLAKKGRWEHDTIAPIIGYLLVKEQEARCVRLILTAKRNSLKREIIQERLREVYG